MQLINDGYSEYIIKAQNSLTPIRQRPETWEDERLYEQQVTRTEA